MGINQLSGGVLSAGTWNAVDGAALDFPSGTTITTNQANLTLSGNGASISGLSGLSANSGSLTLTNGASLATTGSLTNSGSLTLGVGATLTVNGSFTQTSAGTLTDQIGGTPASGQFGEVNSTGSANLAGAYTLNVVNGFTASAGDDYQVLSFASSPGNFTSVNGLGSTFSETLNSKSLVIAAFANAIDLDVASVTAPISAVSGQSVTVSWQTDNDTAQSTNLSWLDDVYLSTTSALTANSILLGSVQHTGGIAADGYYQASLTVNLRALAPANYYVLVETDSLYQVPDPDRTNNTLAATTGQLAFTVPSLTVGTPYTDSFTANDQARLYQISVAAGTSLLLALSGSPATDMNAIYVRFDAIPATYQSDFHSSISSDPSLAIPAVQTGTYYILVYNQSGALDPFAITASVPPLELLQASPSKVGNTGPTTLTVDGLNLQPSTSYSLVGPGGTIPATTAPNVSSAQAYVTFDVNGTTPGSYSLEATNSDNTTFTLAGAVQVEAGGGPNIVAKLIGESPVRAGRESVFYVQYSNTGNEDGFAPLLTLTSATNTLMGLDPNQTPSAMNLQILGINQVGNAGVLMPGQQFQVPVYFIPKVSGNFSFTVGLDTVTDTSDSLNQVFWNAIQAEVSPNITGAVDWPTVYAQLKQEIGTSWGSYISMLDHYATLLPPGEGDASDPADLLPLAVNQAVAAVSTSISGTTTATGLGVTLAGNTITATNSTTGDEFTATILNDDSFVFPTVTPGSYTFSVANALTHGSPAPLTVSSGQAVTGVDVTLDPEVVLTGRVTSAATGTPLPGAAVFVFSGNSSNYTLVDEIDTDTNGDYSLAFVPGSYTLMIEGADGYARTYSTETLAAGPTRLNFALVAESAATGVVSLSDGTTVTSVAVVATLEGNGADPYFADNFTTANFDLESLMAGTYDFSITAPGYSVATINAVTIGQGQTVNLGAIELTTVDPPGLAQLKKIDYTGLIPVFAQFGSDAQTIFQEYFNGSSPTYVPGTLSVANTPVTITDTDDVDSFSDNQTTDDALQATLQQIQDNITNVPEVAAAINSFQDCDDEPYEATFDVDELMSDEGLCLPGNNWQTVTMTDSPAAATSVWKYSGLTNLPGIIAGGVGEGGPPPSFADYSLDNRVVNGTIDLTITPDGQATLTANFDVSIHDTFDFDPGDSGYGYTYYGGYIPIVPLATYTLRVLEQNAYTADVPFDVSWTADPLTTTFHVDTSVSNDCDKPKPQQQDNDNGDADNSNDPNAIIGPAGYGTQNFILGSGTLPYTVEFQNDGSAAAQVVTVTQQLDSNLNWSTFQFGMAGFGNVNIDVPAGLTQYETTIDYQNTDGTTLSVDVDLNFNVTTGLMTSTFTSIDPNTGQAPNGVFDGFLYPESFSNAGSEGYVQYTVEPRSNLPTGTTITQQASVVFDTNAPIETIPPAVNTVDSVNGLTSSVSSLPAAVSSPNFTVNWSGSETGGPGIASYDVYVSDDDGPFTLFQQNTNATSALFSGQAGHTYAFYSVATDFAGLSQAIPTAPQATTSVLLGILTSPTNQVVNVGQKVTFSASAAGTSQPSVQWQVSLDDGSTWSNLAGATSTTLSFTAAAGQDGLLYRAVFSNSTGQIVTPAASLTVTAILQLATTAQSLTVPTGTQVTLTAAASGDPVPTVQWQISTNKGKTFTNLQDGVDVQGSATNTLLLTAQESDNADQYRALFTNSAGQTATADVTLTVDMPPTVSSQPTNLTVNAGQKATFTAAASGNPAATVQWQVSTDGGHTFANVASATSTTLTLSNVSASQNGSEYRAFFSNAAGQVASQTATLTVNFAPVVNTQPVSQAVVVGSQATFTAAASGNPAATVQWQVSTNNGKTFANLQDGTNVQGSATGTLTLLAVPQAASGYQYRALFSNTLNPTAPVASKAAVLTVGLLVGAAAPANVTVNAGQTATFAVTLSGSPTPTVQWQVSSNDGTTWSNVTSGGTSASLILSKVSSSLNGNEYRAVLTNTLGQFTTASATLTVNFTPVVNTQPVSQAVVVGSQVTFTAAASGNPVATVQWQVSTNNGKTFTNLQDSTDVQGSATGTLTLLAVPQSASGYQYRALFSNTLNPTAPVASKAAVLTVGVVPNAATPANVTVNAGQTATFAVTLSGSPTPTVQWQVSSNGGSTWSNVTSGGTSASLILSKVSSTLNGNEYRAVLTNAVGQFTTASATLTVNFAPVVSTQPVSQTLPVGSQVTFTAAASGNPAASVQWQVSTNKGKTFTNLQDGTGVQGSATGTLTLLAVPQSASGYQYRALFSNTLNPTAPVASKAAVLTVDVPPSAATPANVTVNAGQTATFAVTLSGSPTPTVQWQVSSNDGTTWSNVTSGGTSASLILSKVSSSLNGNEYRAVLTNAIGQFTTAPATLTVNGAPVVSTQPVSQTVAVGSQATFTAAASGNPAASVQWQVSTNNGKTFTNLQDGTNVQGSATGTLTLLAVPQSASGYQYRALFNNGIGTAATTSAASLTVLVPPGVQANPSSQTAVNGTATFSVVPTGTTPTVQWQVSTNGTTWQNVTGATTATLKLTGLAAAQNQSRYRAVVRNGLGTFTTDAATLTVLFGPVISA